MEWFRCHRSLRRSACRRAAGPKRFLLLTLPDLPRNSLKQRQKPRTSGPGKTALMRLCACGPRHRQRGVLCLASAVLLIVLSRPGHDDRHKGKGKALTVASSQASLAAFDSAAGQPMPQMSLRSPTRFCDGKLQARLLRSAEKGSPRSN